MPPPWIYHPWRVLRHEWPHVTVEHTDDLPPGILGETDGHSLIRLRRQQLQVERRCTLAHELIHPERGHRSSAHARMVLEDFGLEPGDVVEIRCTEDPCATPGGTVTASVRIPVPIPGLGPVLGGAGPVAVSREHIAPVDRYRAPDSTGPGGAA